MTEEKYGKVIAITALRTILIIVGFICLVLSYIFIIKPDTLSSTYSKLGMGRAEIATFEAVYKKSNSNSDLYNLIQKCLEKDNYDKSKTYIKELFAKDDFNKFASEVNEVSIASAKKSEVAFVVDLESYLESQLLVCEYRLGNKDVAKTMALNDLDKTDNKYSFLFGVYYDEVLTDLSKTVSEAKNDLMDIYRFDGVKDKIDAKITACDYLSESDEKAKVAKLYTKMKIMNYKRNLVSFIYGQSSSEVESITSEINTLKTEYNNLIK